MSEYNPKEGRIPQIMHLSTGQYSVRAWPDPRTKESDSHNVYFEIFEAYAHEERNGQMIPTSWQSQYENQGPSTMDEATPNHTGHVRGDGCADWHLGYEHCCSRQDIQAIGDVLTCCYDWAFILMRRDNPNLTNEQNDANFIAVGEPYDAADDDVLITDCLTYSFTRADLKEALKGKDPW